MNWIEKIRIILVFFAFLTGFYIVQGKITKGETTDESKFDSRHPLFDVRALHLELRKSRGFNDPVKQTKEDVKTTIRHASRLGFNTLILQVTGVIQLRETPEFASKWAYSIKDIRELIATARNEGMDVIPEVNLLTHQHLLMDLINKDLLLNEETYDPGRPEVYEIIFPILDEIIEIFQPGYIHIGHDEVFAIRNQNKLLNSNFLRKEMLKPEEYLDDVLKIYEFLKKRGVGTMMWADMLLDPIVFGSEYDGASVNGYNGYAELINYIPKDIILCDWHYFGKSENFPSYTYLQKKGFTVWGAVWKDPKIINAFSTYVAKYARKGEGMIATTWWPFVINDTDTIDLILETASQAFFEKTK